MENLARNILNKYASSVIDEESTYTIKIKENNKEIQKDRVNTKDENIIAYTENKYSKSLVLWRPPNDCMRIEFDNTPKNITDTWINETERNVIAQGFDYCITSHGGKSDYINIFNLRGIPTHPEKNKKAKELLARTLVPKKAFPKIDNGVLYCTNFSPIIGHPHWKQEHGRKIHGIIRGKNPSEHNNQYPEELLIQLKKNEEHDPNRSKVSDYQNSSIPVWVNEFLLDYCLHNVLPKGNRHNIIEKNLAILIRNRQDSQFIIDKWKKAQSGSNSIQTWINDESYVKVNAGELVNYIKENNIPFHIPSINEITRKEYTAKELINIQNQEERKKVIKENIFDISQVFERANFEIEWIVDGLITANSLNFIVGHPGSFKSFLALGLALDIAIGSRFLEFFSTLQGNVLYIDEENNLNRIGIRLRQLLANKNNPPNIYFLTHQQVQLNELHEEILIDIIKEKNIQVVFLDSLVRFTEGDENSANDMKLIHKICRKIISETSCTVIAIHHVVKSATRVNVSHVRGSGDFRGMADGIMIVNKVGDRLDIHMGKSRDGEENQIFNIDIDNPEGIGEKIEFKYSGISNIAQKLSAKQEALLSIISLLVDYPDGLRAKDITEKLDEKHTGNAVKQALKLGKENNSLIIARQKYCLRNEEDELDDNVDQPNHLNQHDEG